MQIRLIQLSGTDLDEALKIEYVSVDEEENFVVGAAESFKVYSDCIRWIQAKDESTGNWIDCGMVSYGIEKGEEAPGFWIQRLMIHPNFRKKRIATNAIKLILQEAPPDVPIYTSTTKENKVSNHLFKKLGFVAIDENWGDEELLKYESTKISL